MQIIWSTREERREWMTPLAGRWPVRLQLVIIGCLSAATLLLLATALVHTIPYIPLRVMPCVNKLKIVYMILMQ
jgi:hypothetical protein